MKNKNNSLQTESYVIAANASCGTHEGHLTCTLDMAIDKHLLVAAGSANGQVKTCGPKDVPMGVAMDNGSAGDVVDVALLGLTNETLLMRTNDAIKMGDWVYSTDRGRVITHVPETTDVRYLVGMAIASAPAGGLVEVNTCLPQETRVFCKEDMERLQSKKA